MRRCRAPASGGPGLSGALPIIACPFERSVKMNDFNTYLISKIFMGSERR
jgi:hypothetical protein